MVPVSIQLQPATELTPNYNQKKKKKTVWQPTDKSLTFPQSQFCRIPSFKALMLDRSWKAKLEPHFFNFLR